jgi:hypothetical protein
MTSSLWQALDHLGAGEFAARDWRHHLGDGWDICRPFFKAVSGHAETVVDPERPARRLDVVPDGKNGFLGIVGEDAPDGPPLPLTADDVAPLTLEWQAIADALGKALGFAANRYETQGLTRQIGTAQNGRDPIRPVVLCLPAGHFGDHGRILGDLAARRDATVLLPTARWITPPIQALASANRLTLVSVAEQLAQMAASAAVPALAIPPPTAGSKKRKRPLFLIQPGWRWDMLTIEVASGGRIIAACDGQRKEHRFRKSNAKTHSKDYEILMHLAANPKWRNPPTGSPPNEAVRRQFYRFRETLDELIGIPGEAFHTDEDDWKPNFKVRIHRDLSGVMDEISSEDGSDDFEEWHPLSRDAVPQRSDC